MTTIVVPARSSASLIHKVESYISRHWDDTVRHCTENEGTLLGLPFPYTIPCCKQAFQELYYWDTYFTMLGLEQHGRTDLIFNNIRNFLHLLDRHGFIPNGNRTYYLNHSQPPYFAAMVELVLRQKPDAELVAALIAGVKKEYQFWTARRQTLTGLSRYGNHATREELEIFYRAIRERAGLPFLEGEAALKVSSHTLSETETGWDFTPRFEDRCEDFCPVDLNANLFRYEELLSDLTEGAESTLWSQRAAQRAALVSELCWNEKKGAFFDYDFVNQRQSPVLAASTFQPLWTGLATEHQAAEIVRQALPRLECESGMAACEEESRSRIYQWDYPNGWPCLQAITYRGLHRYGYCEEARRVASKYVRSVCTSYEETGDLWEKYNAVDGSTRSREEVGWVAPAMMGWTAGVFLDAVAFLKETQKGE